MPKDLSVEASDGWMLRRINRETFDVSLGFAGR